MRHPPPGGRPTVTTVRPQIVVSGPPLQRKYLQTSFTPRCNESLTLPSGQGLRKEMAAQPRDTKRHPGCCNFGVPQRTSSCRANARLRAVRSKRGAPCHARALRQELFQVSALVALQPTCPLTRDCERWRTTHRSDHSETSPCLEIPPLFRQCGPS
jgi:hypothetical protein